MTAILATTRPPAPVATLTELAVTRVRHPLKFRLIEVKRTLAVSPHLLRVTFGGDDLADFESASFDDHVKLFFPAPGASRPAMPAAGPDGPVFAEGERPLARDFTPRRYDRKAGEIDIEFALHEAGPAAVWAAQAAVGQQLGMGGPRGSFVVPTGFDWHLLVGDETALPAIARRLEELPSTARVFVIAEVAVPAARIDLFSAAHLKTEWRYRSEAAQPGAALLEALHDWQAPPGEGYVWAAGEAEMIRAARRYLCDERGIEKHRIRAAIYWKRGATGVHGTIED